MAPKNKFTRDQMIDAALRVVRGRGYAALTAQSMAEQLGTSTRPIFTCFETMEKVRREVCLAAERCYRGYEAQGLQETIAFLGYGRAYIRFAKEEPELYRLLFLSAEGNAVSKMRSSRTYVLPLLMRIYGLSEREAERYFRDTWLIVHSLGTLIVNGGCPYTDAEIERILTGASLAFCKAVKEVPGFATDEYDRDAVFRALTGKESPEAGNT